MNLTNQQFEKITLLINMPDKEKLRNYSKDVKMIINDVLEGDEIDKLKQIHEISNAVCNIQYFEPDEIYHFLNHSKTCMEYIINNVKHFNISSAVLKYVFLNENYELLKYLIECKNFNFDIDCVCEYSKNIIKTIALLEQSDKFIDILYAWALNNDNVRTKNDVILLNYFLKNCSFF